MNNATDIMQHKYATTPENPVLTLTDPLAIICSKLLAFIHISFSAEYYIATKLLNSTSLEAFYLFILKVSTHKGALS